MDETVKENALNSETALVSPSSSTTSNDSNRDAHIDIEIKNGFLDLSNKLISAFTNFRSPFNDVIHLNISHNKIRSFKAHLFPKCTKINLSNNLLDSIRSITALDLVQLDVSNNDLLSIEGIQNFHRLERLICANNALRGIPRMDIDVLRIIDLSGNLLPDFPDLSSLNNLEELNLADNKIMNLKNVHLRLPKDNKLTELSIASNCIEDITELMFLACLEKLSHLVVFPLPALPDPDFAPFSYRHFLLCILPKLELIDGKVVETADSICGEHLLIQGKLTGSKKAFVPGGGKTAHDFVCNYLTIFSRELLDTEQKKSTPLKDNILKVMKEREHYETQTSRKILSHRQDSIVSPCGKSTDDEFAMHSPFANWSKQIGKENEDPVSPVSRRLPGFEKNVRIIETGIGKKTSLKRLGTVGSRLSASMIRKSDNEDITSSNILDESPKAYEDEKTTPQPKPRPSLFSSEKTPMKRSIPRLSSDRSGRTNENSSDSTPRLSFKCLTTPVSRRISNTPIRKFGVADITANFSTDENHFYERFLEMEERINDMSQLCVNLSKTNETLSCLLVEQKEYFSNEMKKMQTTIDKIISHVPQVKNLSIMRRSGPNVEIKWELQNVKGYNVYINGNKSGTVYAPSRVARISDLELHRDHIIQLQVISFDDTEGPISDPLHITPL